MLKNEHNKQIRIRYRNHSTLSGSVITFLLCIRLRRTLLLFDILRMSFAAKRFEWLQRFSRRSRLKYSEQGSKNFEGYLLQTYFFLLTSLFLVRCSNYSASFQTVSITVPSTHLITATASSVNFGRSGFPQMASASAFSS